MAKKPEARVGDDDEVEPLAATAHTVTSASVGTALTTGAGSITAFTMNQPTATATDDTTPLTLVDAAAAPANAFTPPPRVLFNANLKSLTSLYEPRPGIALTPGLTAPTWPKTLGVTCSFTNGCFVQSCPANVTFTVTC